VKTTTARTRPAPATKGGLAGGRHRSPPRRWEPLLGAVFASLLAACSAGPAATPRPASNVAAAEHALVVVSLDGFRADYLGRYPAPQLAALAARGVRAERLVPSFPTKTFPNHFTLMTGQRPASHGVVGNDMRDPRSGGRFTMDDRDAVRDPRWWQAEPLWITAERQGLRTAPYDWPGSEVAFGGVRPRWWRAWDGELEDGARLRAVLDLLALPPRRRPRLLTLYLYAVDSAGHAHGPDSPEVASAVARVDAVIGELLAGLRRLRREETTDVVVVSDHGMAATAPERAILLDELIAVERVDVVAWSPVLMAWPEPADLPAVEAALRTHPHLTVYRREALPPRLRYGGHPRIPPLLALADEGWWITTRERAASREPPRGEHGYDNALPSMGAIFVAAGPSFRSDGVVVPPFDNVAVYPLLCAALGIAPRPGDWRAETLPPVLANAAARP
jgi:predicted AlkP superfamily pyrophosphatase or phosphodiesterase